MISIELIPISRVWHYLQNRIPLFFRHFVVCFMVRTILVRVWIIRVRFYVWRHEIVIRRRLTFQRSWGVPFQNWVSSRWKYRESGVKGSWLGRKRGERIWPHREGLVRVGSEHQILLVGNYWIILLKILIDAQGCLHNICVKSRHIWSWNKVFFIKTHGIYHTKFALCSLLRLNIYSTRISHLMTHKLVPMTI